MRPDPEMEKKLSNAMPPMSDACYQALMSAARSVKEDERPMKRNALRAVVLTALILILMMTAAYAATQLGLADFFAGGTVRLPDAAKTVLAGTEVQSWQVGPVTFTVREVLCDGEIAYTTANIRMTDGSKAFFVPSFDDVDDCIANITGGWQIDLPGDTSFVDAAKQLGLPMYSVSLYNEVSYDLHDGEEMLAEMWDAEGSLMLIDMVVLARDTITDKTIPSSLYLRVTALDENGEPIEDQDWKVTPEFVIPVQTGVQTYRYETPEAPVHTQQGDVQVLDARMDLTVCGAYLYVTYKCGADMEDYMLHEFVPCDAQGTALPGGISMSGSTDVHEDNTVTIKCMMGIDEAQDVIMMTDVYEVLGCEAFALRLVK